MKMHIVPMVALALTVLVGCGGVVKCNADPDDVFGKHYTASDFQIWKIVPCEEVEQMLIDARLSDSLIWMDEDWSVWYSVNAEDTAAVGPAIRRCCRSRGWYQLWGKSMFDYGDVDVYTIYILIGKPLFDGTAVANAWVDMEQDAPVVCVEFAKKYHETLRRFTGKNIGNGVAIRLGERVLFAPLIASQIADGICMFEGRTEEECCALATLLTDKDRWVPPRDAIGCR